MEKTAEPGFKPETEDVLRRMTQIIVREIHPAQIILFGSRARGDADPDSDVDLLIVHDEEFGPDQPRHELLRRLRARLSGFGVAKDLLLYSRAYVEEWRGSLNHVVGRALREGRVLYERS